MIWVCVSEYSYGLLVIQFSTMNMYFQTRALKNRSMSCNPGLLQVLANTKAACTTILIVTLPESTTVCWWSATAPPRTGSSITTAKTGIAM